ncbi:ribonuclease HI [Suttonella sp. R2A3]|uniref:ribonuclease HI n=1 Tax=Suttonella sp. R2A3 TaxID=2908648 RepID=UPI001F476E94|nr:ribonuclease HI [Suttonella sp. R2A3]UJF25114.1 ribonuclease HI [Suttonella sp. R2A3]
MSNDFLDIYTDGACKGNPGVGGWGVLMRYGSHEKTLKGAESHTTNNRMELQATIEALSAIKRPCKIRITTDSVYVKNGITQWIHSWKKNGWRTAQKKPVQNAELWQQLDNLVQQYDIEWAWVKGHSGHPGNEVADTLANEAIEQWREQHQG